MHSNSTTRCCLQCARLICARVLLAQHRWFCRSTMFSHPLVLRLFAIGVRRSLPRCCLGPPCFDWLGALGMSHASVVDADFYEFVPDKIPEVAGFCFSFPAPPAVDACYFQPSARPLKSLRAQCLWAVHVLCVTEFLLRRAIACPCGFLFQSPLPL